MNVCAACGGMSGSVRRRADFSMADKNRIYDHIIIGSGIAGNVCAYELARHGRACLILEKEPCRIEKVCGGGVSCEALDLLKDIGMDIRKVDALDHKKIYADEFYFGNRCKRHFYQDKYSLGIQRRLFDDFLLGEALSQGCEIVYAETVKEAEEHDGIHILNGYQCRRYVWASGAAFGRALPEPPSVGMSAIAEGKAALADDRFAFWYDSPEDRSQYFWIFPVGENLWNVGVWQQYPFGKLREVFGERVKRILEPVFPNGYCWKKSPKGMILGTVDLRRNGEPGIGDYAGTCSKKNGGGIHYAIKSAIEFAESWRLPV